MVNLPSKNPVSKARTANYQRPQKWDENCKPNLDLHSVPRTYTEVSACTNQNLRGGICQFKEVWPKEPVFQKGFPNRSESDLRYASVNQILREIDILLSENQENDPRLLVSNQVLFLPKKYSVTKALFLSRLQLSIPCNGPRIPPRKRQALPKKGAFLLTYNEVSFVRKR